MQNIHLLPDVLSLPDLARRFGLPLDWVREQVDAGKLPALRIGKRRILMNPAAVKAALALMAEEFPAPSTPAVGGK